MNDWRPFVYGGLASVTAECGTFPIDTTKTRLQVQGQKGDARYSSMKYRGMSHAFVRIFREEGALALYSGIAPAVLRQATYGTIKIGIYHTLKRAFLSNYQEENLLSSVVCGISAGVVSSCVANPTDVLKVRMQARGSDARRGGMICSFAKIYSAEGVRGLWRGVGPTAQRAAIVAGVELPAYDFFKKHIILSGLLGDCRQTHFLASFLAGLAGAVASNPIDVIKTRMMNQSMVRGEVVVIATGARSPPFISSVSPIAVAPPPVGLPAVSPLPTTATCSTAVVGIKNAPSVARIYKSTFDCLTETVRTEGLSALYKGFLPNWLRLGPWNIIFFMTYEQLKKTY